MAKIFIVVVAFIAMIGISPVNYAADIYAVQHAPDRITDIHLTGKIEYGDYDQLVKILNNIYISLNDDPLNVPHYIYLESMGGDILEAMKIGDLVRKLHLHTDTTGSCASACMLIYVAGIERGGIFNFIHSGEPMKEKRLGLHRPRFTDMQEFSELSPIDASKRYNEVLVEVENYLNEMETSQEFIDLMFAAASDEIIWISRREAIKHGILDKNPPSIAEWKIANCSSHDFEREKHSEFSGQGKDNSINSQINRQRILNIYMGEPEAKFECLLRLDRRTRKQALVNFIGN